MPDAKGQQPLFPEDREPDLATLPSPPISASVDLRDFPYMPLYGDRAFAGDLFLEAPPGTYRWAERTWWVSWHTQVPAASLPNDDRKIAALLGISVERFSLVKRWALHGWTLCNDGRLYHRELARIARDKGAFRRERSAAGKKGAEARWSGKGGRMARALARAGDAHAHAREARARGENEPLTDYAESENSVIAEPMAEPSNSQWQHKGEVRQGSRGGGKPINKQPPPPAASPSRAGAHEDPGYAWQSRHAPERHLTADDFATWAAAFHRIDLLAELVTLDEWAALHLLSEADRKRWFHVFSAALKKKHDSAGGAPEPATNGAPKRRPPTAREINNYVPKTGEPESLCDDWPF